MLKPFYDPEKTYYENMKSGPFGDLADGKIYKQDSEPAFELFGHKVNSLFGIAAGPLINGKFASAAMDKGFDIVVYKTVRSKNYPCHKWPNVMRVNVDGNLKNRF